MAKSKTIRVTPNVDFCLKELKEAVKSMPEGNLRERAQGAVNYLSRTFKGEPQPARGAGCPGGPRKIVR
jgi:hypothetical protein